MHPEDDASSEAEVFEPHQKYRKVPSPAAKPTTVVQAIYSAESDRIYTLLLEMVTTIPAAKALAERRLLKSIAKTASPAQPTLKTKAYETCKNCGGEYSVSNNRKSACVYHKGRKELDGSSDYWAEHDDDCHGDPESFIDDEDYAEGFMWSCCGEDGTAEGCVVSKHEPEGDKQSCKRRGRL